MTKCPRGYKYKNGRCVATVELTEAEANIVWDGLKCRTTQLFNSGEKYDYERYKKLQTKKFDELVGIHSAEYYRRKKVK